MRRTSWLALLGMVVMNAPTSPAQQRTPSNPDSRPRSFTIRGNVRYAQDEHPAEMIKVELRRFSGEPVAMTFTRTSGEFEFTAVPGGSFNLVVEEQGYEAVRETVELRTMSRFGLLVYLRKSTLPELREPGSKISAHELGMPKKARARYQKGMEQLYEKKNAEGSLPHFQKAVADAPDYYEAYFQLGVAYSELHRRTEAGQAFEKSAELSQEKFAEPLIALGSLRSDEQKFPEAEGLIRRGLAVDASSWLGHYELARVLFGENRLGEAEKSVGEALHRRADYAPAYLLRANIRIRQKNYPALMEDLEEYLRLAPNGPFSEQARQMQDQIRRLTENAKGAGATPGPKP